MKLEAEIREQVKIKENYERELSILKHAPQLAARRQALSRHDLGGKGRILKSQQPKLAVNTFAAQNEIELRQVINALREQIEASKQRLVFETEELASSKEKSIKSGKPSRETVSALKIQSMEADLDIKTIEDREVQTAIALRTVKENHHRLESEVDALVSQLASQKASVATHQRQKQASIILLFSGS